MTKTVKKTNNEVLTAVRILNQDDVVSALDALTVAEKLRVRKTFQKLAEAAQLLEFDRVEIVKQYAKRDESGEIIEDENRSAVFENETEFIEKINELFGKQSDVEIPVLQWGGLKATKLPFTFINAFDGIFVE